MTGSLRISDATFGWCVALASWCGMFAVSLNGRPQVPHSVAKELEEHDESKPKVQKTFTRRAANFIEMILLVRHFATVFGAMCGASGYFGYLPFLSLIHI